MFTRRLFRKALHRRHQRQDRGLVTSDDVDIRVSVHYGIPSTASILAFDPIQRLLAIGTLDGRIKVIGGDNIEGLLISPNLSPYKYLEFLQNQGFLVSITNDNDIQVWNLERRSIACSLQWESNVTAFSVISGSSFMYVGDEYGLVSVLKYDPDSGQLLQMDYQLTPDSLAEATGVSITNQQQIVTLLPQPMSSGNRLLIAYASGLIILWDVVEATAVAVWGHKVVLQLKYTVIPSNDADTNTVDNSTSHDLVGKEITALCYASTDGSIIAVGYADGDILFWNTPKNSSIKDREAAMTPNVVKLQLSNAEKRLPVVVLHWSDHSKSRNHREGQLLMYGGDEIGCKEVVTVLSLEWSSGMEAVKCTGRVDLTLTGSFSDMILVPSAGATGSDTNASLFVLTNPGLIHVYDRDSLSSTDTHLMKEQPQTTVNSPACIPTVDPLITVAEFFTVYGSTEALGSKISAMRSSLTLPRTKKWPLTGGVSNYIHFGEDNKVHMLYVAGYQDGSVRIWDATHPVFSLLCVLTNEFNSENSIASITVLDLCSSTLRLAVGSECGLVRLYNLCSSDETSLHFVTETEIEVRTSAQVQGPRCAAVFDLQKSRVRALRFTDNAPKLIVGYECSRVAMVDVDVPSVAFITDSISNTPVISIVHQTTKNINESAPRVPDICRGELVFVLTKDASIYVLDGNNGSMISSRPVQLKKKSTAISMYVIANQPLLKDDMLVNEHSLKELYVLLCCKDSLRVYSAKSVVQGENKRICKVKLSKRCFWTTVFRKAEKGCGVVVFYETGVIEIRSLPGLEVVKEFRLLSYLRWKVEANMERMMISSTENSHITLTNGCEVAFISLLEGENDFRIPESLPNLHDEVLAAAANAALSVSSDPRRKQAGILSSVFGGLRRRKSDKSTCHESGSSQLQNIFTKNPFPKPSTITEEEEASELTIDDIEIDEPEHQTTSSTAADKGILKNEREQLLGSDETKPRIRTREEIIAKYRNVGDASSAAGEARNKLMERQEKLERITRRTEDLRNGAENFSSLANDLVKAMERRKWYHI